MKNKKHKLHPWYPKVSQTLLERLIGDSIDYQLAIYKVGKPLKDVLILDILGIINKACRTMTIKEK